MSSLGPVFTAEFPGDCEDCGFDMQGDRVRYVDGDLMHAACAPDPNDDLEELLG